MKRPTSYMVTAEEARAAWLQLRRFPVPVFVRETDAGFSIGPCRPTTRSPRPAVLAGYFTRGIEFDAFWEEIEAAAVDATNVERRKW